MMCGFSKCLGILIEFSLTQTSKIVAISKKSKKPAHGILNEIPFKCRIKIPVPAQFAYSRFSFFPQNTDGRQSIIVRVETLYLKNISCILVECSIVYSDSVNGKYNRNGENRNIFFKDIAIKRIRNKLRKVSAVNPVEA